MGLCLWGLCMGPVPDCSDEAGSWRLGISPPVLKAQQKGCLGAPSQLSAAEGGSELRIKAPRALQNHAAALEPVDLACG